MAWRRPRWGLADIFFSARAVFIVTVLLAGAGIAGAARNRPERDRSRARPRRHAPRTVRSRRIKPGELLHNRPLLIFAGCLLLFHLANAAMLPLMGSVVTMRSARWATVLIAACIVVPQLARRRAVAVGRATRPDLGAGGRCCSSASPRCRSAAFFSRR